MARTAARWLILALLACLPAPGLADSAATAFDQGLDAFRAGDYAAARGHFEAARAAGMDSASLDYNLGATYYRLGQYRRARQAFGRLLDDPANAPLAHYNLGLVARQRGETALARRHFRTAYRTAEDDKIRRLASDALGRQGEAPAADRLSGIVSVAGGYDNNVALTPDETIFASDNDDFFLEALAGGSYQLTGTRSAGWQLKGSLLHLDYAESDTFDQSFLRLGPEWDTPAGAWAVDLAAYGDLVYLAGELFERIATAEVDALRPLGSGHALRLRYRLSRVDGRGDYDYLSGLRHRADAQWHYTAGRHRLRLAYQLAYNDRRDWRSGDDFTSYSPTRHAFRADARRELGGPWQAEVGAGYRISRYHDANVENATVVGTREDTRYRAEAALDRRLPWWGLHAFAEYRFTRNDSNLETYDYTAHVLTLGLERFF